MWDCERCGCQAIAGTINFCPQCFTPRPQAQETASDTPSEKSAEARSSPLSLPADGTPSGGTPEAEKAGTENVRPMPRPSPPPARGASGGNPAAKEWGKS